MVSDSKYILHAVRQSLIGSWSFSKVHPTFERPVRSVKYGYDRSQYASRVQVVALISAVPTWMQYYYFEVSLISAVPI